VAAVKPVLIVDDDEAIREFISNALTDEGYAVLAAQNGAVALQVVAQQQPSLILLDMKMPVLDGDGFLNVYCQSKEQPAPVITISAHSKGAPGGSCAAAFLAKPFDLGDLLGLVEKYVSR
jgi:CheY-like chemotaxis protein